MACRRLALALAAVSAASAEKDNGGWVEKRKDDGRVVQELKLEAPTFTEEDQYGYVMPERYRCDSCKAVMFHLDQELRKKQPRSRRLKQWEYTDIFEATCKGGFEGYGIKLVRGENTLSGPGLKHDDQIAPGSGAIQMGGESWSKRLGEICRKIVFEKVGEDDVYDRFYQRFAAEVAGEKDPEEKGLGEALCATELKDCTLGPLPPPKKDAAPSAKEAKKDKEKEKEKAKAKAKAEAAARRSKSSSPAPSPSSQASTSQDRMDIQAFLKSLAAKHGAREDEYLGTRTAGEWERLLVGVAGKVFTRWSETPNESCPASR